LTRDLLEEHLVYFTYLLRKQGVKAGTAELQDALQALHLIDPSDERSFKTALRGALIKKPAEREIFEKTFNHYFVADWKKQQQLEHGRKQENKYQEQQQMAEKELQFKGESLDLSREEKEVYSALSTGDQDKLKDFIRETEQGKKVDYSFKPVLENLVKSSLRYWKNQVSQVPQRPEPVTGDPAWDWMLCSPEGASEGNSLANTDFKDISSEDIPQAVALARKMSLRLAKMLSRRYRSTRKKKILNVRGTLRENISYGGYLARLKYSYKRARKPRLLVLGDVSGSMQRYSGLVMTFIYGLSWAIKEIECFIFAEEISRVTSHFKKGLSFEEVMQQLGDHASWGKGTCLYHALERISADYHSLLTPRTVAVIISDTRTTSLDRSLEAFRQFQNKVKEVYWFTPLPGEEWENYRSVREFERLTTMLPCRRLTDLERVFSKKIG